ncbi:HBR446Wp [Eremothecium sinecaudum]|uniref:Glutamate--cysteine ligase n=1 Tax=Eremothecium sinecaudum TaxID=45286 RepID=A0A109UXX6_9SACH|nr:HBR446Wp [Eremothecium sinecaudum]AMD19347.1 HBR446Wp [Eremothecium sinecaudum]
MGLLSSGTPLTWIESRKYNDYVRENGLKQLLYVFKFCSRRTGDPLYWGDEIEYLLCQLNDGTKEACLTLNHDSVIDDLNGKYNKECEDLNLKFHPEYGRYMVESTPRRPYFDLNVGETEQNMAMRRRLLSKLLENSGVLPLSMAVFPRMGCEGFTNLQNPWSHKNCISRSLYLPDEIINRHARFPTLTANIRIRRGEKVCINVPMYCDTNTPAVDDTVYQRTWFDREDRESIVASKPGNIYMDSMGFGMGCSCLQETFSAPNVDAARYLYDGLVNIAPIMLAVSASSPFFKGWLAEWDVRWNIIANAVDDRTPFERGEEPLTNSVYGGIAKEKKAKTQRIQKSRYSVTDLYLGGNRFFKREMNDAPVAINEDAYAMMVDNDIFKMDEDLARHFAHLFVRDPLVIYNESLEQDNLTQTDHFENIQSTNWQTLRFKPPVQSATPENTSAVGWRVEFRPLEVQLTDFENAAFATFLYLIVKCLLVFSDDINPYVPISKVWENMDTAHVRDSVLKCDFHWKRSFSADSDYTTALYNLDDIFHNPQSGIFPTFIDRILRHEGYVARTWKELKHSKNEDGNCKRLYYYLKLVSDRAKGSLPTTARYMRDVVLNHPDYQKDSRITKKMNYDIMRLAQRLTNLDDTYNDVTQFLGSELGTYVINHAL